ncbi:MAG TPA: EI24 domain-containing protein [Planctomycetes bacterium]|nr:EI24 domain-containing protein [Planctomycetota bacterium]
MAVPPIPCPLCGYDAPELPCPHCGGKPREHSLTRRLAGPLTGAMEGVQALPRGLLAFLGTPGTKRWMVPPLILTASLLVSVLVWIARLVDRGIDSAVGDGIDLEHYRSWTEGWPGWMTSLWSALLATGQWMLDAGWSLFQSVRWLGWFLLGSLVAWYVFSIAYEALAGPFLDEIQGKLEHRWFGIDPRNNLHRPTDIPSGRCVLLSAIWVGLSIALVFLLLPLVSWGALLLAPLLALAPLALWDRRYLTWIVWVARIEGSATWASLEASALTALLIVLALPLYFVPVVGYFLFAGAAGFATSLGLLDIPFERRCWPLRMRLRFVLRHAPAFLAFGVSAGLLLSIPVLGPLLMVPAASVGGLWLVLRLDKGFLREDGEPPSKRGEPPRTMRRP